MHFPLFYALKNPFLDCFFAYMEFFLYLCNRINHNAYHMKRILLLLTFFFASILVYGAKMSVSSPDRLTEVFVRLSDQGQPQYQVLQDGQRMIDWSALGICAAEMDLRDGFSLLSSDEKTADETWQTVWGEERLIRDQHNELTLHLTHRSGMKMDLVFRVFDDGWAFRYVLPDSNIRLTITDECTEYRFTSNPQAWS